MTYVVTKIIKGNPYLYLVRSVREGDRVVQKFVRYLGRADSPEAQAKASRAEAEEPFERPVARPEVKPTPITPTEPTPEVVAPPIEPREERESATPQVAKYDTTTHEGRNEIFQAIEEGQYIPDDVIEELGGYISDARFSKAMRNKDAHIAELAEQGNYEEIRKIPNYDLHLPEGATIPEGEAITPPITPTPQAKEPWQMTKQEWQEALTNAINRVDETAPRTDEFREAVSEVQRLSYDIPDGEGTGINKVATYDDVLRKAQTEGKVTPAPEVRTIEDIRQDIEEGRQVSAGELTQWRDYVDKTQAEQRAAQSDEDAWVDQRARELIQVEGLSRQDAMARAKQEYPEITTEPEKQREPWEMTKAERTTYIEQKGKESIQKWNESGGKGFPPSNPERWGVSEVNKAADELGIPWGEGRVAIPQHKYEVMVALKQGKPVPQDVLKDYPDLAPKELEPEIEPLKEYKVTKDETRNTVNAHFIPREDVQVEMRTRQSLDTGKAEFDPDSIDLRKEADLIKETIDTVDDALEIPNMRKAIEQAFDVEWTSGRPKSKAYVGIILTNDKKDAGMGSAGTGSAKVFWAPYSNRELYDQATSEYHMLGVDAISTLAHEYHHALGGSGELDDFSEAVAANIHLKHNLELIKPEVIKYWIWSKTNSVLHHPKSKSGIMARESLGFAREGNEALFDKLLNETGYSQGDLDKVRGNINITTRKWKSLESGKPVSPQVLKDYPELAKPEVPEPTQPTEQELTPEIKPDATILEKDFNRMSHKEIVEDLKSQGKPLLIDDTDRLAKLASAKQGYKPDMDRPVFVFKGIEEGVITDGFLLIENKEAAEDIFGKYIENEKKKQVRKDMKLNFNLTEEQARENVDKGFEMAYGGGTYPNYKALYPQELGKEAKLVGVYTGGIEGINVPDGVETVAYLSDGEHIMAVNADKLAFVMKNLPDAKMYFKEDKDPAKSILTFKVGDEGKGLLMPLYVENIPPIIQEKARGYLPETTRPPEPPIKEPREPVKVNPEMSGEILEGYANLDEARETLREFAARDVIGYTARGQEVTPDMLRQAIDIKSAEPD